MPPYIGNAAFHELKGKWWHYTAG